MCSFEKQFVEEYLKEKAIFWQDQGQFLYESSVSFRDALTQDVKEWNNSFLSISIDLQNSSRECYEHSMLILTELLKGNVNG